MKYLPKGHLLLIKGGIVQDQWIFLLQVLPPVSPKKEESPAPPAVENNTVCGVINNYANNMGALGFYWSTLTSIQLLIGFRG